MKKSLIALATAGVLMSAAATADTFVVRTDNGTVRAYAVQHDYRYDRGRNDDDRNFRNDGRQFSIDQRQNNIRNRIQRGMDTGQLTNREARTLFRELSEIEAKERAFENDGRLGRWERDQLHQDLDNLAARLRWERRDDQRRY
jgi:hypothetical protein